MDTDRTWPKYKTAGVHTLLDKAATILDERPFSQGTIRHKETGAVDTVGALALASGVRYDSLSDNLCEMGIPRNNVATFWATMDFVESSLDTDLLNWNDEPDRTKEQAIKMFTDLADLLESTI